jgi:putative thioredoxin
MGAMPDKQVKTFVEKVARLTSSNVKSGLDDSLTKAEGLTKAGNWRDAAELYKQILRYDPKLVSATAGLARCLAKLNQIRQACELINSISPELSQDPEIVSVRTQLELSEQVAGTAKHIPELKRALTCNQNDHSTRLNLALALYSVGDYEAAVDELLEIIRRDQEWNDQAARKQLLRFLEAFGPKDPLTSSSRRRLSSILFS